MSDGQDTLDNADRHSSVESYKNKHDACTERGSLAVIHDCVQRDSLAQCAASFASIRAMQRGSLIMCCSRDLLIMQRGSLYRRCAARFATSHYVTFSDCSVYFSSVTFRLILTLYVYPETVDLQ